MKTARRSISRIAIISLGLSVALAVAASATDPDSRRPAKHKAIVRDWTTHHMIFSHPGTKEKAIQNGTYDRWQKIVNNPRYQMQQQLRGGIPEGPAEDTGSAALALEHMREAEVGGAIAGMTPEQRQAAQMARGGMAHIGLARVPEGDVTLAAALPAKKNPPPPKKNRMKKDWSEDMQSTSGTVGLQGATSGLGEFPATYSTGGTSCSDFAVYNTGLASSSSQASIVAYDNLYSSCNGGTPTTYWAYNPGAAGGVSSTVTNSAILSEDGTQVAFVQSVPYGTAASGTLTANTGSVPTSGSTVTVGSTTYTWTTTTSPTTANQMSTNGITLETEISQTMYAALTGSRANCPSSNATCIGTGTVANSSVTASVSGETVTVTASCGVGSCGNSIVFTQSSTATGMNISPTTGTLSPGTGTAGVGGAQLVVLRWAAGGTASAPVTPTSVSNSAYPTCGAPCMTVVPFNGTPTDTYSSPYYDPTNDVIFVGDDSGALHLFYNIFGVYQSVGPSEIISVYWPKQVTSTSGISALGSPVYDPTSGNVFVGDYILNPNDSCSLNAANVTCGYLYSVGFPVSSVFEQSAQLDYNVGLLDSPIVDSAAGYVYAFVGDDNTTGCSSGPCAGVFQFSTTFAGGSSGTEAQVGPGYEFMMSGTFDNTYYTSESVATTGNLYVVGGTGAANNTLYQIPITANMMGTPDAGPVVATNYSTGYYYSAGLQVTEFYNTGGTTPHDYIFLSVLSYGYGNGSCAGQSATIGCLLAYDVTTVTAATPITSSTSPTGALPEAGGTSGIVIDNGAAGASDIYFSTLLNQSCTGPGVTGTGGCAVQALQNAP